MKHIHVLMAASLGILVACSDLNETDFIEKDIIDGDLVEQVIFEAPVIRALGDDDETRASLSQEGDNPIRFGWEATDIVGIYPNQGGQVYFSMSNGVGTNVASFDGGGWALRKGYTYSCYYPLVDGLFLDRNAIPVSFANQVQNGVSNFVGIRFFLASEGTSSSAGTLRFTFQMLNTVIRIKAIGLPAGTYTKLTLTTEEDLFVQEGTFGLEDMEITGNTYSNTLELSLNDVVLTEKSTEANPVLFYLTSAPVDLTGKTVTIQVYSEDGSIYKCEKKPSKAYAAGAWGGLKCDMVQPNNVIYYTSTDGMIVTPNNNAFDTQLINNVYENGIGIMTFASDITSIKENAFKSDVTSNHEATGNLETISLPASINTIGKRAFYGQRLNAITIPKEVTEISDFCFYGCSLLKEVILPEGIIKIGESAFEKASTLSSINLPSSLISIDGYAFYDCTRLSVSIPDQLESLGHQAFCRCIISSVFIPKGLISIGVNPFRDCSIDRIVVDASNPSYDSRNNCNAIIEKATAKVITACKNTNLPVGILTIGTRSFNVKGITSATIPSSVKVLEMNAFYTDMTDCYCHPFSAPSGLQDSGLVSIVSERCILHIPKGSSSKYSSWSGQIEEIENRIVIDSTNGVSGSRSFWAGIKAVKFTGTVRWNDIKWIFYPDWDDDWSYYPNVDEVDLSDASIPAQTYGVLDSSGDLARSDSCDENEFGSGFFESTGIKSLVLPQSITKATGLRCGCYGLVYIDIPSLQVNSVSIWQNSDFNLTLVCSAPTPPEIRVSYRDNALWTLLVPSSSLNAYMGTNWDNIFDSISGI